MRGMALVVIRSRRVLLALSMVSAVAASSLARAEPSTTEPPKPAPVPNKGRRTVDEPTEIEVLNFVDEVERDPQALAVGLSAGLGMLATKGSSSARAAANFAFTFDFGLGPGGARVPWSIEPFAAFSITPATFNSDVQQFPDRFTELGARLVYRGNSGLFAERFVAVGLGLVWTSWGTCSEPAPALCDNRHDLAPTALVDLGLGIQEWVVRGARYGFEVLTPVEVSKHPGFGLFAAFYGQLGLGR